MQGIKAQIGPANAYSEGAASLHEFTGSIYDSGNEDLEEFEEDLNVEGANNEEDFNDENEIDERISSNGINAYNSNSPLPPYVAQRQNSLDVNHSQSSRGSQITSQSKPIVN